MSSADLRHGIYGDGLDGDLVFDGSTTILGIVPSSSVYTFNRNIWARTVTVNSGVQVEMKNYAMFSTQGVLNNGVISCNGGNATTGLGGAGATAGWYFSTQAGNASSGGSAAGNGPATLTLALGGSGGTGGSGPSGAGGAGGPITVPPNSIRPATYELLTTGRYFNGGQQGVFVGGNGGGGGGADKSAAARGGGGGGGAGILGLFAPYISGTGTLEASGGSGASGVSGSNTGGGGGGGGGAVLIITNQQPTCTIGVWGGSPGPGLGTGLVGGSGASGQTFIVVN